MFNTNEFIWNSCMYCEENEAWFIGSEINALFKMDLRKGQYEYVEKFPDSEIRGLRLNTICVKVDSLIICFPDKDDRIWIFDTISEQFEKIQIDNPKRIRIGILSTFLLEKRIFAVSAGLKQIIEFDIESKKIINYYPIFEDKEEEKIGWECIRVENCLYCVASTSNRLCEFDVITKELKYYNIPQIESGLNTICYDGKRFWFSGYLKKLYVWDKNTGQLDIINEFPKNYGFYSLNKKEVLDYQSNTTELKPFINSLNMETDIWFIPNWSNKILYVNKTTYAVNVFEVPNEEETQNSIRRKIGHKYLVEYVRDNRYIVLYSFKNKNILEIDTETLEIAEKRWSISKNSEEILMSEILKGKTYIEQEESKIDIKNFIKWCVYEKKEECELNGEEICIGRNVYQKLKDTV